MYLAKTQLLFTLEAVVTSSNWKCATVKRW